jgi:hypothetical protein
LYSLSRKGLEFVAILNGILWYPIRISLEEIKIDVCNAKQFTKNSENKYSKHA